MKPSMSDYTADSLPTRRRRPVATAARRPAPRRPPRPTTAPLREPPAADLPDWSDETVAKLSALTPLEQAVVVWRVAGYTGAEAYRKATGRDSKSARQSAGQILSRPAVRAALDACLRDRSVAGRMDRGLMLLKLQHAVDTCEQIGTASAMRVLVDTIIQMARLQGELPLGGSGRREPRAERPGVKGRIDEIVADVARRSTAPKAPAPDPNPPDRLVAETTRPRPRPAVEGPPPGAPPATPPPDQAPPTVDPPVPSAERTWSFGPVESAVTPPHPEDGLPIGVLRAFGGKIRIPRSEAVVLPQSDVDQSGRVLPRVPGGRVQYRGASLYFMGTWQ